MNKIQLLAEQVNDQARDVFSGQADGMVVTRDDLVMFADLIVQECIRECKQELYEFNAEDRSYDDLKATAIRAGHRNGVFKVIDRIKQHFGISK